MKVVDVPVTSVSAGAAQVAVGAVVSITTDSALEATLWVVA